MPDEAKTKEVMQLWRPFVAGARETTKPAPSQSFTLTANEQRMAPYHVDTIGFVGDIVLYVEIAGSNAGGAAVAVTEDAPFSVFPALTFYDVGSKPLKGEMTGSDWAEVVKHGGYTMADDERANVGSTFSAMTTGVGATAGSGSFALRIPVCYNKRTGIGALVNKNAGATLRLEGRVGALTDLYSVAPSGGATVTVEIQVEGWLDAAPVDGRGNPVRQEPPGGDTTQFFELQTFEIAGAGSLKVKLNPIDAPVRALYFILRDNAAGTRAAGDTAFPALTTLRYENLDPWSIPKWRWRRMIAEYYGLRGAADTAGGRSNGVYPLPFFDDFGLQAGVESGIKYLPVTTQTNLSIEGAWGAASKLRVIVDKLYPGNGDPLMLSGGR